MAYDSVALRYTPVPGYAWLRELTGLDEAGVNDLSTTTAVHLLDQVLVGDDVAGIQPGAS